MNSYLVCAGNKFYNAFVRHKLDIYKIIEYPIYMNETIENELIGEKEIVLEESIKSLGNHKVAINLGPELGAIVKVKVTELENK